MNINAAQIHLALNHFPVVLIATSLPFLAWSVARRSETALRTGILLVLLAACSALPAFFTGDPTADLIVKSGVPQNLIHAHEEAAEAGLLVLLGNGVLAAGCIWLFRRHHPRARQLLVACLVVAVASTALLGRAAHLGGVIQHEELRGQPHG